MGATPEQIKNLKAMRAKLSKAEKLAGIGAKRTSDSAWHAAQNRAGRDIKTLCEWTPADPARREACRYDLRRYLLTYHAEAFPAPFSDIHLALIHDAETAILKGGLHCRAFFRGAGKTTVFARALIWAIAYGHRKFAVIVGATDDLACVLMDKHIRREICENETLRADFPELCMPFVALEGHGRKCIGQIFDGERTLIEWAIDRLVCAEIPASIAAGSAGSVILVKPITGAMKGMTSKLRYNGKIIRPDILLLDDIQTRESAGSPVSTKKRIQTVQGDALGLAGHDRKIAAVQAVTPIYDGDLACQFLDRTRMPEWRGVTTSMVLKMPERDDLWDQYREILHESLRNDGDPQAATQFYLANREKCVADGGHGMDYGAVLAWPERIPEEYVSALQFAMELKIRDPECFAGEYQCCPLTTDLAPGLMLSRDDISRKVNQLKRGIVADETEFLTAFLNVNDAYLFYAVCGWRKDFTGHCIEYAAWPPQTKKYHTKADANPTLSAYLAAQDKGLAGSPMKTILAAALDLCIAELLERTWQDTDGHVFRIEQLLVDTRYDSDVVRAAIARLKQPAEKLPRVMPSMGVGYGAKSKPMASLPKKPGDIVGCHWRAPHPDPGKLRHVMIDTNYWKTTLHQQMGVPLGQAGCFAVYGDKRTDHGMWADHLTAELPHFISNETKGELRSVIEWTPKPNRENESLDCAVGCFIAASIKGAELRGAVDAGKERGRKRFNMSSYNQ